MNSASLADQKRLVYKAHLVALFHSSAPASLAFSWALWGLSLRGLPSWSLPWQITHSISISSISPQEDGQLEGLVISPENQGGQV